MNTYKDDLLNLASDTAVDAIISKIGEDGMGDKVKKFLVKKMASYADGGKGGQAIASAKLEEFVDENIESIKNFAEMLGDDSKGEIRKFFNAAFKVLRERFDRELYSILDESLEKATEFSEDLARELDLDRSKQLADKVS